MRFCVTFSLYKLKNLFWWVVGWFSTEHLSFMISRYETNQSEYDLQFLMHALMMKLHIFFSVTVIRHRVQTEKLRSCFVYNQLMRIGCFWYNAVATAEWVGFRSNSFWYISCISRKQSKTRETPTGKWFILSLFVTSR